MSINLIVQYRVVANVGPPLPEGSYHGLQPCVDHLVKILSSQSCKSLCLCVGGGVESSQVSKAYFH